MAVLKKRKNQEGQATTEYILMIAFVVFAFGILTAGMTKLGLGAKLLKPLQTTFAATYQFGHPLAQGFDPGPPQYHPRAIGGDNNFRMFLNPGPAGSGESE